VKIFSMILGSLMHAMIRTVTPLAGQVSMSIPNTRLSRSAQVITAWRIWTSAISKRQNVG
jgi:hypothetical protein